MPISPPLLKVSNLAVVLDGETIFKDLSFELSENENLVILGPNGAGKTVLLKALLGLVPSVGTITWQHGITLAYVPQRLQASKEIPLTVRDFFELRGLRSEAASQALNSVGISDAHFLNKQLSTLSTGQFQRVLIGWAMSRSPEVILFDEPMAGVDVSGEDIIHSYLHNADCAKRKISSILVTHDLSMVYREATRVLCLNRHSHFIGTPLEVLDPKRLQDIYGHEINYVGHNHV